MLALLLLVSLPLHAQEKAVDEQPTIAEMAGGVLVLIGVYLAIRPRTDERIEAEVPSAD